MNTVNTPKMKNILSLTNYFSTLSPNNIFEIFYQAKYDDDEDVSARICEYMEGKISKKEYKETKIEV